MFTDSVEFAFNKFSVEGLTKHKDIPHKMRTMEVLLQRISLFSTYLNKRQNKRKSSTQTLFKSVIILIKDS